MPVLNADEAAELRRLREEVAIWRRVGHRIQAFAAVTGDHERLGKQIARICDWSYAHRCGNGEIDNEPLVAEALKRLADPIPKA